MSGQGVVIPPQREDPDPMIGDDELALNLEYSLTIAVESISEEYQDCNCASYLILRRKALTPAILKMAGMRGLDPAEVFAGYARALHATHAQEA